MSQTTVQSNNSIGSILEQVSSYFIMREQLRSGVPLGYQGPANTTDAYPKVQTGVDSDGSTMQATQWVQGVDNTRVLAGAGVLVALGIIVYAVTR